VPGALRAASLRRLDAQDARTPRRRAARPHLLAHMPLALSAAQDERAGQQRWDRPAPRRCRAAQRLQEGAVVVHTAASGAPHPPHQRERHPCAPLPRARAPCPRTMVQEAVSALRSWQQCPAARSSARHRQRRRPATKARRRQRAARPAARRGAASRGVPHRARPHRRGDPARARPPQAFCGSPLSAHRCRVGTLFAQRLYFQMAHPRWPAGSLLPDGRQHLSASAAAMSDTSPLQPARAALAMGLLGKQAAVDGCQHRRGVAGAVSFGRPAATR